ncbi:MAG: alpha/beta fold hydrolase [Bacteroidetes bacterium]|nr:MAG: alpha/beta fold hydrolase [Bacteroidota bacterium]TAG87608.1 MAG: alpha/beta fold hydrolase [Bacteroidota bacterium]
MPLISSNYQKSSFYFNSHIETIIPAVFRVVSGINYQRKRLVLEDNDFLDLDYLEGNEKLVILSHGLEGDTKRGYIKGMAKYFHQKGYSVLAWNHRSCSGELNSLPRFYHSGATEDLRSVVQHTINENKYSSIYLIGFSLGGNVTLKYLGEEGKNIHHSIKKSCVFSVPLHLSSCSKSLSKKSNWIYSDKFKQTLFKKIKEKSKKFPEEINPEHLKKVKTLFDFDNYYTAPLHNFKDAEDYYEKNSSLHWLDKISIPTLIVNALNDPFLGEPCFPYQLADKLDNVYFEFPSTGGHCGFSNGENGIYWSEKRAGIFLENEN